MQNERKKSAFITYLGKALYSAMMGLLVVYCLKEVSVLNTPFGILELFSIIAIILLHKWKNNVLISIGSSTIVYMILVQKIYD